MSADLRERAKALTERVAQEYGRQVDVSLDRTVLLEALSAAGLLASHEEREGDIYWSECLRCGHAWGEHGRRSGMACEVEIVESGESRFCPCERFVGRLRSHTDREPDGYVCHLLPNTIVTGAFAERLKASENVWVRPVWIGPSLQPEEEENV